MSEDKRIHEQPVPTVAKPDTDAKLQGAPVEPEAEMEKPDEPGDHSAGGLIRQAWALREASGMHEIDTRGRDAPTPEESLGASVARGDVPPVPPATASTGEKMSRSRHERDDAQARSAEPRPEGEASGPEETPDRHR